MGSLNTSRQKIKLLDIETLAANGVPAAGNPHATLKTPNNKFFVGSNNGPYVHVLNNIYGSLLDMTSVNTGLGGTNADLSYNTVDNMIYGISTFVYSMDPNTLAVTPFYSIAGGGSNAALTNDGLNLYVGDNGYIRKYRISDQTFLTNYNFANGYVHSMKVTPDNQYVLATTISITGGGGKLIKIKISDGTVSTLDFSSTIGGTPTDDFVIIGDYIYVGDESSYKGGKINWKNMTIDKVINLPMNCWLVSTDAQYVYFGARSNLIFCFDPATERTATLNVPFNFSGFESLNELVYIENNIWLGTNYATNNAKIVRLYMNPFSETDKTSAKVSIKKQNTGSGIFSIKKSPKKTYKAFFPVMGNHDYEDINKTGIDYLNYFPFLSKLYGNTSGKSKYYDIKLGPCHFFILDSDPVCGGYFSNGDPTNTTYAAGKGDGNPATTSNATYNAAQKAWYNAAIAASTSKFKFTIFHHPSYDYTLMAYSNGWRHDYADFVLHGHYHNFQRYYEVHNSEQVKYIITGNGGRSLYDFDTNAPNYIFRNNTTYGFTRFDVYENGIRVRHYSLAYQASSFSVIYDETVGTLDVFSFTFAAVADWGKGNGGGTINAPSSLAAHTDFPGNYYINLISQEIRNQNINYIFGVGDLTYVGLTYLYVGYKLNASTPVFIDENIGRFFSDYITDYKGIYSDGKVNSNLLSIGTNSIFYGNQQYEYSI